MSVSRARILGLLCAVIAVAGLCAALLQNNAAKPSRDDHPIETSEAALLAPGAATSAEPLPSAIPIETASASPPPAPSSSSPDVPPKRCPAEAPLSPKAYALPPSSEELFRMALEQPEALGPASIGSPTRGKLFGGVELKNSEGIVHSGGYAFGTDIVVQSIERAVKEVRRCHPNSPVLYVGDISRDTGGWLRPHRSHQAGLDADIGYYYKTPATWYLKATAQNLDVERTWTLVRAILEGGHVEMIFMDLGVQKLLKDYIAALPAEEQIAADLFQNPAKKDTLIRHTWGHATHFHVRYADERAKALGDRLNPLLPRLLAARKAAKRAGNTSGGKTTPKPKP